MSIGRPLLIAVMSLSALTSSCGKKNKASKDDVAANGAPGEGTGQVNGACHFKPDSKMAATVGEGEAVPGDFCFEYADTQTVRADVCVENGGVVLAQCATEGVVVRCPVEEGSTVVLYKGWPGDSCEE